MCKGRGVREVERERGGEENCRTLFPRNGPRSQSSQRPLTPYSGMFTVLKNLIFRPPPLAGPSPHRRHVHCPQELEQSADHLRGLVLVWTGVRVAGEWVWGGGDVWPVNACMGSRGEDLSGSGL